MAGFPSFVLIMLVSLVNFFARPSHSTFSCSTCVSTRFGKVDENERKEND